MRPYRRRCATILPTVPRFALYGRTSYGFANQAETQHFDGMLVRVHNEADRELVANCDCPVVTLLEDQAESWASGADG